MHSCQTLQVISYRCLILKLLCSFLLYILIFKDYFLYSQKKNTFELSIKMASLCYFVNKFHILVLCQFLNIEKHIIICYNMLMYFFFLPFRICHSSYLKTKFSHIVFGP